MMERQVITVTTLVRYLKGQLESNGMLHGVYVEGEISNMRRPYSGHWYFSIKDDHSSLPCVMFASANRNVKFPVQNGNKVMVRGDVTVYESEGRMQLLVSAMQPSGIGALYMQLEALKKKLAAEGLFDEAHKQNLPPYPMNIAVVTGNHTAARSDVLTTLQKRWPLAEIHEYPCPVQGSQAATYIVEALQKADEGGHDLILLVRGGGSVEDLWCFNDEQLARTIYHLKTPIVTGVGHETDTTLVDYVSDHRANTPTGAVELSVPDQRDVLHHLENIRARMIQNMQLILHKCRADLEQEASCSYLRMPEKILQEYMYHLDHLRDALKVSMMQQQAKKVRFDDLHHRLSAAIIQKTSVLQADLKALEGALIRFYSQHQIAQHIHLDMLEKDMQRAMMHVLETRRGNLEKEMRLLDAYSPLKVMDRGYSITMKDNKPVHSIKDLQKGDLVTLQFHEGSAEALIKKINEQEEKHGCSKEENI